MRIILSFLAIVYLSSCAQSPKIPVAGLWKNVTIEQKDANGSWERANWMRNGTAYLHYDEMNMMSAHFVPDGFDTLKAPELDDKKQWDIELLSGFASDYWYLASYKLNGDQVQHTRILHSNPADNGITVTRNLSFSGDTLILYAPEHGLRLKWLPANP